MRMKQIYASASGVLIWTGNADDTTELAFDTLETFAAGGGNPDGNTTWGNIRDVVDMRRAAVSIFLRRSYFTRIWVIQEVVVARNATLVCGSFSMTFDKLHTVIERIVASGFLSLTALTTNVTYLGDWRRSHLLKKPSPLPETPERPIDLRIFLDSRDRTSSNLHDKIYALRGLVTNDQLLSSITVDYNNSIERVYTDLSKYLLRVSTDLRILSAVILYHRRATTLNLPSWVPDWSQPKLGGGILQRYYRFAPTRLFRAAGASNPRVSVADHSDIIRVEGIRLDTVERIIPIKSLLGTLLNENNQLIVTETSLRQMTTDLLSQNSSNTYPFTGEPYWTVFFRTLTADRTALSPRIDEGYRSKFLSAFGDWKLDDHQNIPQNLPANAWAKISEGISVIIEDKDMFLTTRGYLGLSQEGFRVAMRCAFFLVAKSHFYSDQ